MSLIQSKTSRLLLVLLTLLLAIGLHHSSAGWLTSLQTRLFGAETQYSAWMQSWRSHHGLLLFLAFAGGLLASLSPCCLSMLPLNLTYIGTREARSRRQSWSNAALFVVGTMITLSILGLSSALASFVFFQYSGFLWLAIGSMIILMGLSVLELIQLSLPQWFSRFPVSGSWAFGLLFPLIASPCASPVLLSIVALAGITNSQVWSVAIMLSYALGYTLLLFVASVCTGLAQHVSHLKPYTRIAMRVAGCILLFIGCSTVFNALTWFALVYF